MITVSRQGTTDENNRWVLPEGVTTMDSDTNEVRVHDGEIPGGYRIAMKQAFIPQVGPGPVALIAGEESLGYYGQVLPSEFIDGQSLATEVGLASDNFQHNEAGWLKFSYNSKVLFIAQKTFTYASPSWADLVSANVIDGSKEVSINGTRYRVRLIATNQEWNDLMYRVASRAPANAGAWDTLSDEQLGITSPNGSISWIQERAPEDKLYGRGRITHPFVGYQATSTAISTGQLNWGWRPVLELVT